MGTINDKLNKLEQTKTNLRNELNSKGAEVGVNDTFASYVGKLHDLEIVNAQAKTVNPSTSSQTVLPDSEHNALSQVTINPVSSNIDQNIQSGNIKAGITILNISGKLSVVDTEDSNAVADDIMQNKTAYVNGSKLTGTLNLDTEIANQTALITQLEELVQSKSVIQPVFENGNMSSLNSQVKKFIEPVIEAFTDYLDELQEQNVSYLDEPITIYAPDENMQYFIIVKNTDNSYRILWSKSKYAGFYFASASSYRINFLKIVGVRTLTDEITVHNANWNWSIYGFGGDTNWLNKNDAYASNSYSSIENLIEAISNPQSSITYTHPQNATSYTINVNYSNYITNMISWKNNNGVQSKILDTIVTTKKLSNNVTILPLNS